MILHGAVELTKNLRNPHHDCKREVFNGAKHFEDENAQDLKAKTKIAIYGLNIGEYPKHRTGSGLVNKLRNLQRRETFEEELSDAQIKDQIEYKRESRIFFVNLTAKIVQTRVKTRRPNN